MADELLSGSVAGEILHEQMPDKTAEQWRLWLQNNRNQTRRVSYRIPFERMAGGVFYRRDELAKFAEWERARQLGTIKLTGRAAEVLQAFGIGEKGSTTQGRRFKGGSANLVVDAAGEVFVQTIINEPLMVFAMSADQAIDFGKEMAEAGKAAKRHGERGQKSGPASTDYETIVDTPAVLIKRRKESK
jgi:hypothetical protein